MSDLLFPHEREFEATNTEGTRKTFERDPNLFMMLPSEDKKVADNKLFFLAFNPNRFPLFAGWPDMNNYYQKFFVHFIEVMDEESGNVRRKMVLCGRSMNKYAKEKLSSPTLPVPAIFDAACAFCEHSQVFWDEYAEAKKEAGIDNLTREGFKEAMQKHPEVAKLKDLAMAWSAKERYYFAVFDYAKSVQEKPLDKADDGYVRIQGYFGPESIPTQLYRKQKNKSRFWDFEGDGYRVVVVTRDNSVSAMKCEYFIDTEAEKPELSDEVLAYLQAAEDIPDPMRWIDQWTLEQQQSYVESFGNGAPTRQRRFTPRAQQISQASTVVRPSRAVRTEESEQESPKPPVVSKPVVSKPTLGHPAMSPPSKLATVPTGPLGSLSGPSEAGGPAAPTVGGRPKIKWR